MSPKVAAVKLDTTFGEVRLSRSKRRFEFRHIRRLRSDQVGAAGYTISRQGAEAFLRLTETLASPVDIVMFCGDAFRTFRIEQLVPALALQRSVFFHLEDQPEDAAAFRSTIDLYPETKVQPPQIKPKGLARLWRRLTVTFPNQVAKPVRFLFGPDDVIVAYK